jgi:hypothetical protein
MLSSFPFMVAEVVMEKEPWPLPLAPEAVI